MLRCSVGVLLILSIHHEQAPWIIEAEPDFWAARQRHGEGDAAAIIDAYRVLSEGVMRRYGSMVIGLEKVAAGQAQPTPLLQPFIGDVESRLTGLANGGSALPGLLLHFIEPRFRNAAAHANVIVDSAGDLLVQLDDGSLEAFSAERDLRQDHGYALALDDVDIATTIVYTRDILPTLDQATAKPIPITAILLMPIADRSASNHTSGSVVDVAANGTTHTLRFSGEAGYNELLVLVNEYRHVVSGVVAKRELVRLVDLDGNLLHEFAPLEKS